MTGWSSEVRPLDTERILRAFADHGARVVIVGGVAAILYGYVGSTVDLDAVPALDDDNLNRLGAALQDLRAVPWADSERRDLFPDGRPPEADDFGYTAEGLRRHPVWHLTSDAGLIDIVAEIVAAGGYVQLAAHATHLRLFDADVEIAALDDIIASKRALGRTKDLMALARLIELRAQGKEGEGVSG